MKRYFYGDPHLGHPMMAEKRGFENSFYMDRHLIEKYKETGITDKDEVYFMGDVSFRKPPRYVNEVLSQLRGKKFLIIGNHDKATLKCEHHFKWMSPLHELKFRDEDLKRKMRITLCHYCMRVWPASHHGAWHVCAHSHGNLSVALPGNIEGGLVLDSGCDNFGLAPVSYEVIKEIMLEKEKLLKEKHGDRRKYKAG